MKDGERRERVCYKLITPSNIIYNSIIFNILHFLHTRLYLLHLFQGLKCLPLPIIETYTLACRIFKISQFNIYNQSNINYFSIILFIMFCRSLFVFCLLAIVLSLLLRFTDFDYPLVSSNSSYAVSK